MHAYTEIMGPDSSVAEVRQFHEKLNRTRKVAADNPDYLEAKAENGQPRITQVAYVAPEAPTLDAVKEAKIETIDSKTYSLIVAGFTYNTFQFSSSERAQANFLATELERVAGRITYPMLWSTLDGGSYAISDETDWNAIYSACLTHIRTLKLEGLALRAQVSEATTVEDVEAISDDR